MLCVGTPDDCMRVLAPYEALGIEAIFRLCAIGPVAHQEVYNTMRRCGECVIPHVREKQRYTASASALITRNVEVH